MRPRSAGVAAIVVLTAAIAACGGGSGSRSKGSATAGGTITCLRGIGADVLRPESNTYIGNVLGVVAALHTADLIMVRMPSGAITTVAFPRQASVPASVLKYVERRGRVLLAWSKPPSKGDDERLTGCLVERSDAAPKEPVEPLGCAAVFLREGANRAQVARVEASLERSDFVRTVNRVSKEKALEYFRQRYPDITNALSSTPLPDTLYVTPRQGSDLGAIQAAPRRFGTLVGHLQLDAAPCPR